MDLSRSASVLTDTDQLDIHWLHRALGRQIRSFDRSGPTGSNWGLHLQLRVTLLDEPAPLKLHLKIGSSLTFGHAEVDYYTHLFRGLSDAPLVPCHAAVADDTHYNLLLEDLSETHRDQKEIEPTEGYGRALVEAAAKLHAFHWHQPAPAPSVLEQSLAKATAGQDALLEAMKEGFSADERATVRTLLHENAVARNRRLSDPEGFAWVHGDINPTNVLAPIHGHGLVYLLDHQPFADSPLPHWLAVNDLAYAIVLWWPVETRRALERQLVEHWHSTLMAAGAKSYPLSKAWEDWRLCGLQTIAVPSDWCSQPDTTVNMRGLWEAQLRRVLAFAQDHLAGTHKVISGAVES
jgi:hypothetical protein